MFVDYSKEQIKNNLETVLTLEWLGIHIEGVKDIVDKYGIPSKTAYYFSVPETSTIDVEGKTLNSDGLIVLAKEKIIEMLIGCCNDEFGDDEEFIENIKNNQSDYFKFYAKIRTGEVWNRELGDATVKKITDEILANSYKAV